MTIKRNVQLPISNREGVKPRADELDYGNLAVNFFAGDEFLSTKNSNNEVVVFPSKNYIEKHPFSSLTLNKINFDESTSIEELTGETSSKTKLNITAEDEHLYYNGKPIANVADSLWEAGTGTGAVLLKGSNGKALGELSVSEGTGNTASGNFSHAEGVSTTASGYCSHAEGYSTTASGNFSHAEGYGTKAVGQRSHAEGEGSNASGYCSHAEGCSTTASGNFSHAEGYGTTAIGTYSHAEGISGIAYGNAGHVEGIHTHALNIVNDVNSGDTHITLLFYTDLFNFNLDYYKNCYICGPNQWKTRITGASYDTSATIPDGAKAIRFEVEDALPIDAKQADEEENNRHGTHFYTWKYSITNIGTTRDYAQHAEGEYTMCIGDVSHAEGKTSMAVGEVSHAEGQGSIAYGDYSHAEGNHTIAMNEGEHACGSYNRSASGSGQVFSVGVGTSNDNRVNSFYVKNDGTIGSDLDMSISGNSKITLSTASDKLIMSAGTLTTNCTMTTGAYFTTSDERLKTNIIGVTEDEIEKAKKVDLKSFNLKRDGKKHFGVVAQEVEAAGLAELVNTDSEGMKSVDYTSLLILKIAELEKEIKDLKNQINNK